MRYSPTPLVTADNGGCVTLSGRLGAGVPYRVGGLASRGRVSNRDMFSAQSARGRAILRRDERAGSLAWGIYGARVEDG